MSGMTTHACACGVRRMDEDEMRLHAAACHPRMVVDMHLSKITDLYAWAKQRGGANGYRIEVLCAELRSLLAEER